MLLNIEKVLQASLCLLLGSGLNINKEDDQNKAQKANDVVLVLNVLIVAANVLISAFEMKETDDSVLAT